jgi:hypothetical protein
VIGILDFHCQVNEPRLLPGGGLDNCLGGGHGHDVTNMDMGIHPESFPIVLMITPVGIKSDDVTRFVRELISSESDVGYWPPSDFDREFAFIQMGPPLWTANVAMRSQVRVVPDFVK